MTSLLLVTLAIIVSGAFAYNFEDAAFNKFLVKTMDEAYDIQYRSPLVPRNRRAAQTELDLQDNCSVPAHHFTCCGPDKMIKMTEEKKALKMYCINTMLARIDDKVVQDPLSCEHLRESKKQMICLFNCWAEKYGAIQNGEIHVPTLTKEIDGIMDWEVWQKALFAPTIQKCLPIAKAFADSYPKGEGDCSPLAIKMWHCMWRTFNTECPADKVLSTPMCAKMIELMKKSTM